MFWCNFFQKQVSGTHIPSLPFCSFTYSGNEGTGEMKGSKQPVHYKKYDKNRPGSFHLYYQSFPRHNPGWGGKKWIAFWWPPKTRKLQENNTLGSWHSLEDNCHWIVHDVPSESNLLISYFQFFPFKHFSCQITNFFKKTIFLRDSNSSFPFGKVGGGNQEKISLSSPLISLWPQCSTKIYTLSH